jgi:hypothetical protein
MRFVCGPIPPSRVLNPQAEVLKLRLWEKFVIHRSLKRKRRKDLRPSHLRLRFRLRLLISREKAPRATSKSGGLDPFAGVGCRLFAVIGSDRRHSCTLHREER